MRGGFLPGGLGLLVLACGSSLKPPPPPLLPATSDTEAEAEERRAYAEVVPASKAPPTVPPVWLHLHSPHRTLAKLPTVAQGLPPIAHLMQLQTPSASPFGAAVASVIDLSQPVDLVLEEPSAFLSFQPTWAFRVRSPEAILRGRAGLTLHRVSAGVWNMGMPSEPGPEPTPDEDSEGEEDEDPEAYLEDERPEPPNCQLRHLPPPVGYRVICSYGLERLTAHAPFLSEAAREQGGNDVRVELGGEGYKQLIQSRKRIFDLVGGVSSTSSERMANDLMRKAASSLFMHDELGASLTLTGEHLQGQLEMRFAADLDEPLLLDWLQQSSHGGLPESCGRLPRDGAFAACFSGIGDEPVQRLVKAFMEAMNEDLSITSRDSIELEAALGGIIPPRGHLSVACGVDPDEAWTALTSSAVSGADEAERPLSAAAVASLQAALGGWCTTAIDVAPERYLAAAQRAYRTHTLRTPRKIPEENRRFRSFVRTAPTPRGLPPKTLHLVDEHRPDPQYKHKPLAPPLLPYDLHVLVVPDRTRTWLVTSRSEKLAVARARALLAPVDPKSNWPELQTLAGKSGLGFVAMDFASVDALSIDWDSAIQRAAARDSLKAARLSRHKGQLKVPFWLDVVPRQGAAGHNLRLRTEFPLYAVIADLMLASPPDQD